MWVIWEKAGNRQLRQIHVATLKNPYNNSDSYNNSNRENHVSILTPSDSGTRRGNDWTMNGHGSGNFVLLKTNIELFIFSTAVKKQNSENDFSFFVKWSEMAIKLVK